MAIEQVNLSEWDSSLASLMRLDQQLQLCNNNYYIGDYNGYMKACVNAWKEARVKATSDEKEKGDKLRKEIRDLYNKIIMAKNNSSNPNYNIGLLFVKLEDWENFIRFCADRHNLLIRNKGNVLGGNDNE